MVEREKAAFVVGRITLKRPSPVKRAFGPNRFRFGPVSTE